nr:MAG TPA: YsxB-like protein [Siphoviridae sp. cttZS1]
MIQVTYNEVGDEMILRAEGHAGYAEKGKDIVCAAVSVLMQTLAYSIGTCMMDDGRGLSVQAHQSCDNMAKFELVTDGLILLAKQYPENVRYTNVHGDETDAVDLQLFAEGGDGGSGAGETSQSAGADSFPDRGALGREENSALGGEENAAPDEAEGRDSESKGEEAKKQSPEERRKAFGQMMSGEYKDLMDEYTDTVSRAVEQRITASPEMRGLLEAIAEKYGTDATDLAALTEAVKNGVVKDDSYFEKIAMEKGVSVKTARELDKLETQNRRLTAQQEAAAQMQKAAQEQARIAQIQAQWDAEAEALKAKYPEFDREEVLANPEVGKMMRAGCSMEAAYRAAYFDRLMARQTAATAQQTEQGVLNRVQQRGSRPSENGTRPGGAVQTRMDVEHMSRKDREALEKRVLRGEIITF